MGCQNLSETAAPGPQGQAEASPPADSREEQAEGPIAASAELETGEDVAMEKEALAEEVLPEKIPRKEVPPEERPPEELAVVEPVETVRRQLPPLSLPELRTRLKALILPPLHLVTKEGDPLLHLEDLNQDGNLEILVPCAIAEEELSTDRLSDFTNVFQAEKRAFTFHLLIFERVEEELALASEIDVGSRFVYGGIRRIPLMKSKSVPFATVVSFQTPEGEEQEWLIFDGRIPEPISRLSLKETYFEQLQVEDIDEDGVIDVVLFERAAEEGVGLETFLTWLRWTGMGFQEYANTNIVRNLNAFLAHVKQLVLDKDWEAIASFYILEKDIERYTGRGWQTGDILALAFGIRRDDPEFPSLMLEEVRDIVFPFFLENPFLASDERGRFVHLTFRIVDVRDISLVFEAPLYMAKNPFGKRQFFIALP
jgi:hypothetical protein